jgi:hypothetical protein
MPTVAELKSEAKAKGVKGYSTMKKAELEAALRPAKVAAMTFVDPKVQAREAKRKAALASGVVPRFKDITKPAVRRALLKSQEEVGPPDYTSLTIGGKDRLVVYTKDALANVQQIRNRFSSDMIGSSMLTDADRDQVADFFDSFADYVKAKSFRTTVRAGRRGETQFILADKYEKVFT